MENVITPNATPDAAQTEPEKATVLAQYASLYEQNNDYAGWLAFVGYDSAAKVQSYAAVNGIGMLLTLTSAALMLISSVPMLFYSLDEKTMAPIYSKKRT